MEKLLFRNLINGISDILLPQICLSCKKEACPPDWRGFFICDQCRENINEYKYFVCPICKRRSVDGRLDKNCRAESGLARYVGAPLPYSNELVKKAIHALKYRHAKNIARPISQFLIEFLDKNKFMELVGGRKDRMLLVPVPLYNFRERERGFNQATEIAKCINEYYEISLAEKILIRRKNTEPQADITTKEDRAKNISGAFICKMGLTPVRGSDPCKLSKKIVILVDDVYTSGATMRECAITLKSASVSEVWGMTVARG